jgi:uncharacterized protein (DUF2141 family)
VMTTTAILLSVAALAACGSASADPGPPGPPEPLELAAGARPATIVVEMTGFRNAQGKALVALFDREDGFPDGKRATKRVAVDIVDGAARASFRKLPAGSYAISVLHDEDGDFEMKTNALGMPKEGYGASNNARRRFGPPEWDAARFELASGRKVVQKIRLIYH